MLKLVRRKGSPYWYARGTVKGVRIYQSTKEVRVADAKAVAHQIERDALEGHRARGTFVEALGYYLDQGGEDRYLLKLLDHFKETPLGQIDQLAVSRAAQALYPNAAPSTIRRQVFTPMTAVLNCAAYAGLCKPPKFKGPKVPRAHRRAAPPEWFDAVLPHSPTWLQALLIFMASTGARVTEALSLKWTDVNLLHGTALLQKTKGGEPREVPLADGLKTMLEGLQRYHPNVFGRQTRGSVYTALRAACEAAGVEYYSPHEAGRHTFATTMLREGYSLQHVAVAGGWKSIRMVSEHYGHLEKQDVREAVNKIGAKIGGNLTKP